MVEYDITINNQKRLYDWIAIQPGLISIAPFNTDKIYCEFNHTPQQSASFKEDLIERLAEVDIGNNTFELLMPQLRQIKTDQAFYSCEFNPGITKTNIGLTYVNIFTDFSGRPFFIDTTGFKSMAIQILWTKVGTGVQTVRIVNDADNTQVLESGGLGNTPGASDDFPNVAIPPAFLKFKGKWRLQAKSTVAADDPIFVGIRLYLRRD